MTKTHFSKQQRCTSPCKLRGDIYFWCFNNWYRLVWKFSEPPNQKL